ncbi:MAG: hypothetical protein Q9160_001298 [Pyrenula sp. 1 TL-2023]
MCRTDLDEKEDMPSSFLLQPNISKANPLVVRAEGNYMHLDTGQLVFDATGGPAVACIGHGDPRVRNAVAKQMDQLSFCHSLYWSNQPAEMLAKELVCSTGHRLTRAVIYGSGSEAVEAAMKLARQHYLNLSQSTRTKFIARRGSFHGTTLGALALTGHAKVRQEFEPLLASNITFISACNPYRDQEEDESSEDYVARLAKELDDEFCHVGKEKVCAFIAETVAGSSLGCVPAAPGYFRAMKAVCEKHGALLILDEVICGMGRTGTVHAWEQEDVVPDIQVVAKGLGGGYAPISALLMGQTLVDAFQVGARFFNHGHTYQAHSVACAAALEVQNIIKSEDLVQNVIAMGKLLGDGLKANLSKHPYVGDIRGRGLLWAIEFVQEKASRQPFPTEDKIAMSIRQVGLQYRHSISLQPGGGSLKSFQGDHIILAPAYNVTRKDIELIVSKTTEVITEFFAGKGLA